MNPTVHGVMAYEDIAIAKLAKEKWDYLVTTLSSGYDFELRLWKFDVLRIPEMRDAAVSDAARAHLVFVVTRGAGELPPDVKAWIEQWVAQKESKRDVPRLLTFLFDPPPDKSGAFAFSQFAYLQQAARKGSMDFLASTAPTLGQQHPICLRVSAEGLRSWENHPTPGRDRTGKRVVRL